METATKPGAFPVQCRALRGRQSAEWVTGVEANAQEKRETPLCAADQLSKDPLHPVSRET